MAVESAKAFGKPPATRESQSLEQIVYINGRGEGR